MNDQQNTILRFAIIFLILVMAFIAVIVKIIVVQTSASEREYWALAEAIQDENTVPIAPVRGNIYDCNGQLLASSIPQYTLYMDPLANGLRNDTGTYKSKKLRGQKYERDTAYVRNIDTLCAVLGNVLKWKTPAEYRAYIDDAKQKALAKDKTFSWRRLPLHKDPITYIQYKRIQALPFVARADNNSNLNGLMWEKHNTRSHPFGNLAWRTLGTNGGTVGRGHSGIEGRYDSLLHGVAGLGEEIKIDKKREVRVMIEPVNGADIMTTLDANLQDIVEKELRGPVENYGASWGCCVLMDVHTGELKAVANLEKENGKYAERKNRAFLRVDPGSTFKTVSLLAALDDHRITLNTQYAVTSQPWKYLGNEDSKHTDSHKMDATLTMRQALAVSSNIAFAKMVTTAYHGRASEFVAKLQTMGLRDTLDYDVLNANNPLIRVPKDKVTIAKMAYGYAVELSPIQIAAFYAAVANGGTLYRPMLVRDIIQDGKTVMHFDPQVVREQIASKEAIADVRKALHDVVWDEKYGTARFQSGMPCAQSDLVRIAGKTGTAQLRDDHGYTNEKHRYSFVGYFPEEDPQYVCMCVIEDPQYREELNPHTINAPRGCATVVRKVAEKTMAYTGCYTLGKKGLELHKRVK